MGSWASTVGLQMLPEVQMWSQGPVQPRVSWRAWHWRSGLEDGAWGRPGFVGQGNGQELAQELGRVGGALRGGGLGAAGSSQLSPFPRVGPQGQPESDDLSAWRDGGPVPSLSRDNPEGHRAPEVPMGCGGLCVAA